MKYQALRLHFFSVVGGGGVHHGVVMLWVPMTPPIMEGVRCPHVNF